MEYRGGIFVIICILLVEKNRSHKGRDIAANPTSKEEMTTNYHNLVTNFLEIDRNLLSLYLWIVSQRWCTMLHALMRL